jgi:hypothetical protein
MAVRTNVAPNPSFESAVWSVITNGQPGSSSSVSATQAFAGTSSAKLVNTGTNADDCYMDTQITGLTVGADYTISGYLYIESNTDNPRSNRAILAYAAGITNVTTAPIGSLATGSWLRYSLTINTGAGSTLDIRLYAPPGTAYWDAILVEQGVTLNPYFDGNSSASGYAYAWTGTPHSSPSTETSLFKPTLLLMGAG